MQLTKEDIEDFENAIAAWTWERMDGESDEEYQEMLDCHEQDRRDLQTILDYLVAGEDKKALDACSLDTIVRDQIPERVWDYLMEVESNEC